LKLSDFRENEVALTREAETYNVALDAEPTYAAMVGSIISMFALIEGYAPQILSCLTGLSSQDARAIMGAFRAFSNRLDLIKAVYKTRGPTSVDAIVGGHYVSLLNEANRIRNKYAHATYSTTRRSIILKTFSGDYNKNQEQIEQTESDFPRDITRLRRITAELHGLIYRNEIPISLHRKLQKVNR